MNIYHIGTMDEAKIEKVAKEVGTNEKYIRDGNKLKQEAPEVYQEWDSGKISLAKAKEKAFPKPKKQKRPSSGMRRTWMTSIEWID